MVQGYSRLSPQAGYHSAAISPSKKSPFCEGALGSAKKLGIMRSIGGVLVYNGSIKDFDIYGELR